MIMSQMLQNPPVAIRTARPSDEEAILDICLRTADRGQDASHLYSDPRLPGFIWALPYVRFCPETSFVLTLGDEVMGYCVATPDTVSFEERLQAEWWPKLRADLSEFVARTPQDENVLAYFRNAPRTPARVTMPYPAHLHINLLPQMQNGGHGSRLLRHQLDVLAADRLPGAHLGIDPRNESVIGFYSRFGFVEIERTPSILMGKPF